MNRKYLPWFYLFILCYRGPLLVNVAEIREYQFESFYLCDNSSVSSLGSYFAWSRLNCVGLCVAQDTCNACTYGSNGTCNLYADDLDTLECLTPEASGSHYKKVTNTTNTSHHCQNGGSPINATACQCVNGYVGTTCERLMVDCTEGLASGHYPTMERFYLAQPSSANQSIQIRCDTTVEQMLLVRWANDLDFNVSKDNYVNGFGSDDTDYWVGLEKLHLITSNPYTYTLIVQVSNITTPPFYQHYYYDFEVKGADEGYAMTFTVDFIVTSGSIVPMGDCLSSLKDMPFSTHDNDNDNNASRNCASEYGGGWWYNGADDCSDCNLMGELHTTETARAQPGKAAVNDVFWLPGFPDDFSPCSVYMFLFR